jgi:hypothetical protein
MNPEQLDWVSEAFKNRTDRGLMLVSKCDEPDRKARRIERLPPSSHFTVAQALGYVRQTVEAGNLKEIMVIGYQDDGEIYSISSHMSREWALWLLHEQMDRVRDVGRYAEKG